MRELRKKGLWYDWHARAAGNHRADPGHGCHRYACSRRPPSTFSSSSSMIFWASASKSPARPPMSKPPSRPAEPLAEQMRGEPIATVLTQSPPAPSRRFAPRPNSVRSFNRRSYSKAKTRRQRFQNTTTAAATHPNIMNQETPMALGFIETQGFTAVFEAIDTACKAASVEVVGQGKTRRRLCDSHHSRPTFRRFGRSRNRQGKSGRPGQADRRPRDRAAERGSAKAASKNLILL